MAIMATHFVTFVLLCGPFTFCILALKVGHKKAQEAQNHFVFFVLLCGTSYDPALALIFHVSRSGLGHFAAEIPVDYTQREIYPGRQAAGSGDLLLFDKA